MSDPGLASILAPNSSTVADALSKIDEIPDKDARIAKKKALLTALLDRSDRLCGEFLSSIDGTQRTYRTTFGIFGTLLGGAGAIVTPARTAKLLSALSGAASGINGDLDSQLFNSQAVFLVGEGVTTEQAKARVSLKSTYSSDASNDAAAGELFDAVLAYHSNCSVRIGLQELHDNTADANPKKSTSKTSKPQSDAKPATESQAAAGGDKAPADKGKPGDASPGPATAGGTPQGGATKP